MKEQSLPILLAFAPWTVVQRDEQRTARVSKGKSCNSTFLASNILANANHREMIQPTDSPAV